MRKRAGSGGFIGSSRIGGERSVGGPSVLLTGVGRDVKKQHAGLVWENNESSSTRSVPWQLILLAAAGGRTFSLSFPAFPFLSQATGMLTESLA